MGYNLNKKRTSISIYDITQLLNIDPNFYLDIQVHLKSIMHLLCFDGLGDFYGKDMVVCPY